MSQEPVTYGDYHVSFSNMDKVSDELLDAVRDEVFGLIREKNPDCPVDISDEILTLLSVTIEDGVISYDVHHPSIKHEISMEGSIDLSE